MHASQDITRSPNRAAWQDNPYTRSDACMSKDERRYESRSRFHVGNRERTRKAQTIALRQARAAKHAS